VLRDQPLRLRVLDLRLPDMSGFEVVETDPHDDELSTVPVLVFTGASCPRGRRGNPHMARSIVVKRVESPERLSTKRSLFLHR